MKCNVGKTDKIVRLVLGATIIILGFVFKNYWGISGYIFIASGLFEWCPVYALFGKKPLRDSIDD